MLLLFKAYFVSWTFQSSVFEKLAVELQEHYYRHDVYQTRRILTYELRNFSRNTCLSLAHMCESKSFIAHPCAQAILSDLWYGGLRESRFISAKVTLILIGLVLPPFYPMIACLFTSSSWKFLEFKTCEELSAQPQTWEEYLDKRHTSSKGSSSSISTTTSLSPNSYSTAIRTRVLDHFNLTTPLDLLPSMSGPVWRNKHFKVRAIFPTVTTKDLTEGMLMLLQLYIKNRIHGLSLIKC
ncbi:unnamed protein product [Rodentolepis nana]|uniref:ABC transmembrane type-1 domain-containing protein n=1 Tax=Rodentolepis nana TaxID=102285 RepID=A0A0R3TGK9_RODNA|nr:unnamed protein product [Rodentolepis nana]